MKSENPDTELIFGEALRLSVPAERAAYLDRACGGNQAFRQKIESLLSAYAQAGDFLNQTRAIAASDISVERTGAMIGRYRLLEKIGEGGFGVVYMAEQEEPVRRRVALKIIKLGMDFNEVVARFEAERQALAMMDHPSIARVFDGGATDTGRPYFVMELVKGIPITAFCDANKLPTRERLELFMQVCHAVQHAHQKGVIHRDLKPSNILVTVQDDRPVPKVIDFGVAKATQARLTEKTLFTRFNQWIGTPAYMSPEQAGLGSLDVDTRSDVYSLGVLLYELLTGHTPFDTQKLLEQGYEAVMRTLREVDPPKPSTRLSTLKAEELSQVATQRHVDPAKLERAVRGDLDWIVMKALEKDRARRYETANALAADLERHFQNEPVVARPPSRIYRIQRLVRRNKGPVAAVGAVAFVLLLGGVVSAWQWREAVLAQRGEAKQRHQAEARAVAEAKAKAEAEEQRARAEAAHSQNLDRLVGSYAANGAKALDQMDYSGALVCFAEALQLREGQPDQEAPHRLQLASVLEHSPRLTQLWFHNGPMDAAVFSPDGRWVAGVSPGQPLGLWKIEASPPVGVVLASNTGVHHASFSSDGQRLLGIGDTGACIWEVVSGKLLLALPHMLGRYGEFSTDGRLIATAGLDGSAKVWNGATGEQLSASPFYSGGGSIAFSPEGRRLATTGDSNGASVVDVSTGERLIPVLRHQAGMNHVVFNHAGTRVATASYDRSARVWDAATGKPVTPPLSHGAWVCRVAFSPDDCLLASCSGDGTIRVWEAETGKPVGEIMRHQQETVSVAFSGDGQRLLTASLDGTAQVWNVGDGKAAAPPLRHAAAVNSAVFDWAGQGVLTASGDGTLRLWDLVAGDLRFSPWKGEPPRARVITALPQTARLPTHSSNRQTEGWDADDWRVAGSLRFSPWKGEPPRVITALPQTARLATQSSNRQLEVWDADDWRIMCDTFPPLSPAVRVWQSRDGKCLLGMEPISGAKTNASRCRLWNFGSSDPVLDRRMAFAPVDVLAVDSQCRRVVASAGQRATVWVLNAAEPAGVLLPHSNRVARAGFSPDGRSVFTVSGTAVHLWNATSGQSLCPPLTQRCGGSWVNIQAEFSPDGSCIVIGPGDNMVEEKEARVWNAHTGQPVSPPLHHKDGLSCVAFSPDGRWVVTGSKDRTARLWDARSGRPIIPPMWHPGWVNYAAFSADSRRLVTSSLGTVRVWDTATGSPLTPPLRADQGLGVCFFVSHGAAVAAVCKDEMFFWKLPCDTRPVKDLIATAHLLSGHQVDPTGVLAPVEVQALSNAWAALSVAYPSEFMSRQAIVPPVIMAQPVSETATEGDQVELSVLASGAALCYQWHHDAKALPGQTSATLSLSNVTFAAAGDYSVLVTNALGCLSSSNATLNVIKVREVPIAEINFDDKPPSAYSADSWSEKPASLITCATQVAGMGVGGTTGLVMTADGCGMTNGLPQAWAGFGLAATAFANRTNGINTTNLNLYKLYATVRTTGLRGQCAHGPLVLQFMTPAGCILGVAMPVTWTSNFQTYSFVLGNGSIYPHNGGSWAEFLANFDLIDRVLCSPKCDRWLEEYGEDADNALYIDNIKFVRLVPESGSDKRSR